MERSGLIQVPALDLRTADLRPIGEGRRTDKVHLSELIRLRKQQAGEKVGLPEGETEGFRPQMGFLFERALEVVWREYCQVDRAEKLGIETQLTLEHDGILMTPDGWDPKNKRLESYKLTWKSARKWAEDIEQHFWAWLEQEKGYLWAMSHQMDEPILSVLYYIGFVNGEYKGKWKLGVWTEILTFTLDELQDNWDMYLRYKKWKEENE